MRTKPIETKCHSCSFFRREEIFDICTHKMSMHKYNGEDFSHTTTHMRALGQACGPNAVLYTHKG